MDKLWVLEIATYKLLKRSASLTLRNVHEYAETVAESVI